MRLIYRLTLLFSLCCSYSTWSSAEPVMVVLETTLGNIEASIDVDRAPLSAGSFLEHLDQGLLEGGGFYRVVRPDNDKGDPIITVIQGGVLNADEDEAYGSVPHETTETTGIKHVDGVLSLARYAPGTASGGSFFICIGDQPSLDFGGTRNKDLQGFAAFGKVTAGMEVVKAINNIRETQDVEDAYVQDQMLVNPVVITAAYRR